MQIVGNKLVELANKEKIVSNADLLGRSAFNRYYYSAYLITRELLKELDTKWAKQPHSAIPDLLRKAIVKKVKENIQRSMKLGTIDYGEGLKLQATLKVAANELANMMSAAYAIRIIADYEPDIKIVKIGTVFSLEKELITTARHWSNQASSYTTSIRKVWREVGLG